ncbi:MAG: sigma-70 family RNA polymerase sigma factor [Phycisphaeraceae bacterium]|nr:sigma-70 family RNA polymerase sigma factor [Phycisphaeraceae bacterium]MCW5753965.1 sigma-70 family RNA polymerase sigma factor [Phycisphaeraceae bacterium]
MSVLEGPQVRREVLAAMRGDPDALRTLWQQHRRWVAAILLAHKPREADLEDLLQEVAMVMVRSMHELRDPAAFKPWLRMVAVNAAKALGRSTSLRRLRYTADAPGEGAASPDPGPEAMVRTREEGRQLLEIAEQLPEGYREPLLMRCIQGMSYREIGRVLDLPETTIETRIARGRRMLRELLAGRATRDGVLKQTPSMEIES